MVFAQTDSNWSASAKLTHNNLNRALFPPIARDFYNQTEVFAATVYETRTKLSSTISFPKINKKTILLYY